MDLLHAEDISFDGKLASLQFGVSARGASVKTGTDQGVVIRSGLLAAIVLALVVWPGSGKLFSLTSAGARRVCWVCTVSGSSGTPFYSLCGAQKGEPRAQRVHFSFPPGGCACGVFAPARVRVEPPARPARARLQQPFHQPNPSAPADALSHSPYHSGLSKRSSFSTLSSHELCQPVLQARARLCRAGLEQQK